MDEEYNIMELISGAISALVLFCTAIFIGSFLGVVLKMWWNNV